MSGGACTRHVYSQLLPQMSVDLLKFVVLFVIFVNMHVCCSRNYAAMNACLSQHYI